MVFLSTTISADTVAQLDGIAGDEVDDVREYLLGVVVGLNWMYGFRGQALAVGNITSAQRAAHEVIIAVALFPLPARCFFRLACCWRMAQLRGQG